MSMFLVVVSANAEDKTSLKSEKDKLSYSLGYGFGENMKKQGIDIKADIAAQGLKDSLSGKKGLMTEKEIEETMAAFQKEFLAKKREEAKKIAEKNKKEGEDFLAENKKKAGVKTTSSGLQYKIIKKGTGKTPQSTDSVTVNYRGTLIDGTEFDSSFKRGTPATFQVGGVIRGWTEALQLMKEGAKWQLFIPSDLAYGQRGAGGLIGPDAVLIFEVELISIN
jgi:FKBP-type peptidyl-prolyl cis-trans isomerase FklB